MPKVFHFRIPLRRPLVLRHGSFSEREGLIVELTDDNGLSAYGECSPLPGFSAESLADCKAWLSRHRSKLLDSDYSTAPSSVQSSLDQARLWLQCKRENHTQLVHFNIQRHSLPVNALLTGSREEVLDKAAKVSSEGFTAVKLKVGRGRVTEDISLTREVRALLPDDISLRLDANQSWSYDDGLKFARAVDWEGIEYCEEPLADPDQLPKLLSDVPAARIALDESFTARSFQSLIAFPQPTAIILRPQLLGGITSTRKIINQLALRGISVVISSAVESSLGMLGVMLCALSTPEPLRPAGLDTLSWMRSDSILPSLAISRGNIDWPAWWESFEINDAVGQWHEL